MAIAGPAVITRLDPGVVNRIAAGEIIQKPSSALKELLENALDAGATSITVISKDGGSKILQIQDNGHGIREEDMPILCERHTTSKLRQFEDLQTLQTLGFRGEALASISFVSHVTITTQPATATHALRATYHDGVMDPPGPVPCASNPGTTILVEDMFYNVPLRKKALKSAGEEHAAILDIVGRYALYKPGIAFVCKRSGESRADLVTLRGATRLQNIRTVHGAAVARNVVPISFARGDLSRFDRDDALSCQVEALVTSAGWSGKKTIFVLFINGRPVDCSPLQRALEAAISALLQRPTKPFLFLDITLPSHHVDVNVHPTKKEVAFLHQEDLIDAVREEVEAALLASDHTRTFLQTQLPGAPVIDVAGPSQSQPNAYRPERLVRTDAKALTLDAYLGQTQSQADGGNDGPRPSASPATGRPGEVAACPEARSGGVSHGRPIDTQEDGQVALAAANGSPCPSPHRPGVYPVRRPRTMPAPHALQSATEAEGPYAFMPTALEIGGMLAPGPTSPEEAGAMPSQAAAPGRQLQRRAVTRTGSGRRSDAGESLVSVQEMVQEVQASAHPGLVEVLKNYTYVGMADPTCVLLQHGTRLYAANVPVLLQDLAYQQVLIGFGEFDRIHLDPPLCLSSLLQIALEDDQKPLEGREPEYCLLLITKRADMLADHFAIDITPDGCLASLPALLDTSMPSPLGLPSFILALACTVDWFHERPCFRAVAEALAALFGQHTMLEEEGTPAPTQNLPTQGSPFASHDWQMQHQLLPLLRARLVPDKLRARDGTVQELTRLEQLYRVFERC
ncbi:MLH1 [Auxenochlorella protothecoides x Auxenochlorella symbiontica]